MTRNTAPALEGIPPRPVEDAYWVVPGRLLVGAYPGSRSRAQAMDRLRRFLEAGVTCFIDLTESEETGAYESLLPFATPAGRRVEYLREPIVDHGVPEGRDAMARILAMLDGALESGHVVYLHCRAGIGRSAMAAACWLAERRGSGERALAELATLWPQAVQSQHWPSVPETPDQVRFVLQWTAPSAAGRTRSAARPGVAPTLEQRVAGAWYGLALGDALGATRAETGARAASAPLRWTQHTAMTLCLAESLLEQGRCDARDQIERYVHWQRDGDAAVSADVAKALATYRWRGLPMAGSHDPRELAPTPLPRVLAAVSHAWHDPAEAVALGAEVARTTHQSPLILDACRCYAAMLVGALRGEPAPAWLEGLPEPAPALWSARPLRKDVAAAAHEERLEHAPPVGSVLHALFEVRRIVRAAHGFGAAVERAARLGKSEAALYGALAGTLLGARDGLDALPAADRARLEDATVLDRTIARWLAQDSTPGVRA